MFSQRRLCIVSLRCLISCLLVPLFYLKEISTLFFSLPNRKNTTTHHQHPSFSLLPNKAINSIQLAKTVLVWYFTITSVLVERNPQFTESDLKIVRLYMTHSCIPPRVIVLVKALYDIPCLQTDLHRPHLWGHVRSQSGVKPCSLGRRLTEPHCPRWLLTTVNYATC